jgi:hypothetical protein
VPAAGWRKFVIIFDGMTFNGEAFVLVLRFVDDANVIRHLVWRFKLLACPMTVRATCHSPTHSLHSPTHPHTHPLTYTPTH